MKTRTIFCLVLLLWSTHLVASAKTTASKVSAGRPLNASHLTSENIFNLTDFGAVGDGVTDDGPALQSALNAIGEAGGGTLFVPAGRFAIVTPVQKDFTGLALEVTILGVESSTPAPPPNSGGGVLTHGLDLVSEFAPRTGEQAISVHITGLQTFLIEDITFIGTPEVNTDALVVLALQEIGDATVRHCEFYGLSSLVAGAAILLGVRSDLKVEQSVFLGDACSSGYNASVVQNIEWKGFTISDSVFTDYGQRAELYGKLHLASPFSWVSIGNAAAVKNDSPRREAVIRNVFFDEGALSGLSSRPNLFEPPLSAPIDLVYVTGMYINVSNLGTWGTYLYSLENALIEDSHYGWSHNADSAINLLSVGNGILDRVECGASADRIRADSATGNLVVIDSVYNHLDSLAQNTRVITTSAPDDDPVQYVRLRFNAELARNPDAAAHFYWSDQLLQCADDAQCVSARRTALDNYLVTVPQEKFAVSGRIVDENGSGMENVTVTLSGSQNVTSQTDADGRYQFSNLPTSGVYTVTPSRAHYTLTPGSLNIVTPAADQTFNSAATFNHHAIGGRVADGVGNPLANVTVTLSGSESMTVTTGADGEYLFEDLLAGGNYSVTPQKTSYAFSPQNQTFNDLDADQNTNFAGTLVTYTIAGIIVGVNNNPMAGVTISLSGSEDRTATTGSDGEFSFTNVLSEGNYTVTPTFIGYEFTPASRTFNSLAQNQYHAYVATLSHAVLEFSATSYSVAEGTRRITVTVRRSGDISGSSELVYSAADGTADQRGDVIPVIGRLNFAPNETSKTFVIFITDDSYVEGDESMTLELGDLVGGVLGSNNTATLTITDNDSSGTSTNPIDDPLFFVRQQYRDFLNRPADSEGLAFWSNQILSCGTDAACIADRRMNVSAAFFLSIEFQETGFLVYRLYKAAYGQPPQHLDEFLLDTRTIGQGVIVNAAGWQELLEANKKAVIEDFVAREAFTQAYPLTLTPLGFVNLLNTQMDGALSPNDVAAAVAEFQGAATSDSVTARALALRRVAESGTFTQRELSPAFVLMQYFGYLQRNPSDPPNTNLDGYNFWLHKLEEFGGDFRRAEMVKSFLVSTEYRARFGAP